MASPCLWSRVLNTNLPSIFFGEGLKCETLQNAHSKCSWWRIKIAIVEGIHPLFSYFRHQLGSFKSLSEFVSHITPITMRLVPPLRSESATVLCTGPGWYSWKLLILQSAFHIAPLWHLFKSWVGLSSLSFSWHDLLWGLYRAQWREICTFASFSLKVAKWCEITNQKIF